MCFVVNMLVILKMEKIPDFFFFSRGTVVSLFELDFAEPIPATIVRLYALILCNLK